MSLHLRAMRMDLADMQILCDLLEFDPAAQATPRTPEQRLEDRTAEGAIALGTVALVDERPVGVASLLKPPADVIDGAIGIWVVVDPAHRRCGIGRRLASADDGACVDAGLRSQLTVIDLKDRSGLEFAGAVGFEEIDRGRSLVYEMSRWDRAEGGRVLQACLDQGVEIISINMFMARCKDWAQQIHALGREIFDDIPTQMGMSAESWIGATPAELESQMRAMRLDAEGSLVAIVDGSCAATSWVTQPRDGVCGVPLSGSGRAWRRRGLVRALKHGVFAFCHSRGVVQIRTHQTESNASMMKLNEDLGFQIERGHSIQQQILCPQADGSTAR